MCFRLPLYPQLGVPDVLDLVTRQPGVNMHTSAKEREQEFHQLNIAFKTPADGCTHQGGTGTFVKIEGGPEVPSTF